jgi:hypothetical protein
MKENIWDICIWYVVSNENNLIQNTLTATADAITLGTRCCGSRPTLCCALLSVKH